MDEWMRTQADTPIKRVLTQGSGFGGVHELLIGKKISPALEFGVASVSTSCR
jgi:hypothetical protein